MKKSADDKRQRIFLYLCKFVVFEFQSVTHIHTKGKQGNGHFGDNTGGVVADKGVVTTDINDGAKHGILLYRMKLVAVRFSYSGRP